MSTIAEDAFLSDEHRIFRSTLRRWVADKLAPRVDEWEREKHFPRSVYREMGEAGYLGVGFPEEYGGAGGDLFHVLILSEELTRSGSPGLAAGLGSLGIALPPIVNAGTDEQKQRFLPKVLSGEWISALAVTEPDTGSDVAGVRARAELVGDHYVLNGAKTFITSGMRADLVTAVVRTGGPGFGGISLLVIETDSPGFSRGRPLDKLGWHPSDTAELFFEDLHVPAENLLGMQDGGFAVLMQNFAGERLMLATACLAIAEMAYEAARDYAGERKAFGKPLVGFQVTRHKLAEMATGIDLCRTYIYGLASRLEAGDMRLGEVAMAKNAATDMASKVVDEALQIFGGAGYMAGSLVERLYRDARLYPIGGGTREIMNEIISKNLGF